MARAQKVKSRDVSLHSRAARRATSPSIDVDKSLLNTDRAAEGKDTYSPVNTGVSKKRKGKQLTRQQRLRQEKGMEKAVQNLEKLSKKVAESHTREKKVKTRNIPWEDLNEKIEVQSGEQPKATTVDRLLAVVEGDADEIDDSLEVDDTQEVSQLDNGEAAAVVEEDVEIDEVL